MAITSIMREKLGTDKPLGTVTLAERESAREVLRKGTMFIRRNLNKRDKAVSPKEISDIIGYLFDVEGSSLEFKQGLPEEPDAKNSEAVKSFESFSKQYTYMSHDFDSKAGYRAVDVTWTQFMTTHRKPEGELLTVFVGKPNQFKSDRNGAIYSYKSIDGLTMQMNLDRLVSLGVLVAMFKEVGVIGGDELLDKFIKAMVHETLPQSKTQIRKNWGYRVSLQEEGLERESYQQKYLEADRVVTEGFKRTYRMELNIKSMEDYERGLGKSVATAFETKKNIPVNIQQAMAQSKLLGKGFKFVELDEDTDLEKYKMVEEYYLDIEKSLPKLPLHSLRFRKLGKHSIGGNAVSGLYSPFHGSIAVDLRMFYSFVHEYGHAIDYMYEKGEVQCMQYEFTDILNMYEEFLPSDIDNKSYYLTPTEVFARGFEVAFREKYYTLDTGLMKEVSDMKRMPPYTPFYQNKELYDAIVDYMKEYLK